MTTTNPNRALADSFGGRGPEVLAAYRELQPDLDDRDLLTVIATDRIFRTAAIRLAEAGIDHRPTFLYLFAWETPVFDGKLKR